MNSDTIHLSKMMSTQRNVNPLMENGYSPL